MAGQKGHVQYLDFPEYLKPAVESYNGVYG
jgi:hypothetical protein